MYPEGGVGVFIHGILNTQHTCTTHIHTHEHTHTHTHTHTYTHRRTHLDVFQLSTERSRCLVVVVLNELCKGIGQVNLQFHNTVCVSTGKRMEQTKIYSEKTSPHTYTSAWAHTHTHTHIHAHTHTHARTYTHPKDNADLRCFLHAESNHGHFAGSNSRHSRGFCIVVTTGWYRQR